MATETNIAWCDSTFNGWLGCAKVSPGCEHCYAETLMDTRYRKVQWGKGKPRVRTSEANWKLPLKWNRDSERARVAALHSWPAGKPMPWNRPRVFCSSLADWLDDEVPIEWLRDLLVLIQQTPNLDWLLLTKRPQNFSKRIEEVAEGWQSSCEIAVWWSRGVEPRNVWVGTTTENQHTADERIPILLAIPAIVRFLSVEPMLGLVSLSRCAPYHLEEDDGNPGICNAFNGMSWHPLTRRLEPDEIGTSAGISWVICGGESGPGARPMHPDWARSLRDQCAIARAPFFMKQMGGTRKPFAPIPDDLMVREFPTGKVVA